MWSSGYYQAPGRLSERCLSGRRFPSIPESDRVGGWKHPGLWDQLPDVCEVGVNREGRSYFVRIHHRRDSYSYRWGFRYQCHSPDTRRGSSRRVCDSFQPYSIPEGKCRFRLDRFVGIGHGVTAALTWPPVRRAHLGSCLHSSGKHGRFLGRSAQKLERIVP